MGKWVTICLNLAGFSKGTNQALLPPGRADSWASSQWSGITTNQGGKERVYVVVST